MNLIKMLKNDGYLVESDDRVTPVYQERLNSLSASRKKIVIELACFWDAVKVGVIISELLTHKQYYFIRELFNHPSFGDKLKESVRPLYYVSIGFLPESERGEELLKASPELEENISQIREEILTRQKIYQLP
ncbi:MAG: hypothetical protein FJY10_06105 [Bacteroidetes bacterium]|nr:hypothetical protein [Bacteroidota bacterium]